MPGMNKIALFGTGRIGRLIFSGIDALHTAETKSTKHNENFLDSLTKVIEKQDYKSLVDAYKQVQRKYYPEKDILIKK